MGHTDARELGPFASDIRAKWSKDVLSLLDQLGRTQHPQASVARALAKRGRAVAVSETHDAGAASFEPTPFEAGHAATDLDEAERARQYSALIVNRPSLEERLALEDLWQGRVTS